MNLIKSHLLNELDPISVEPANSTSQPSDQDTIKYLKWISERLRYFLSA